MMTGSDDGGRFIGVVGGMGPFTGPDLVDKIHQETLAGMDQEHLPVVLASFPGRIPDRGSFVVGQSDVNPASEIEAVIRFLGRSGAAVAGIPCVTAHCPPIFDRIEAGLEDESAGLALLSLVEETVRYIAEVAPGVTRVGALSTTASFKQRVFAPALVRAGYEIVVQDASVQDELVNPAIFDPVFGIKSTSDGVTREARDRVLRAVVHLRDRGAEAVILGCTELPLAVPEATVEGVFAIDPTRALARALIREFAPARLRPLGLKAVPA